MEDIGTNFSLRIFEAYCQRVSKVVQRCYWERINHGFKSFNDGGTIGGKSANEGVKEELDNDSTQSELS
jgi:hypothetical protein